MSFRLPNCSLNFNSQEFRAIFYFFCMFFLLQYNCFHDQSYIPWFARNIFLSDIKEQTLSFSALLWLAHKQYDGNTFSSLKLANTNIYSAKLSWKKKCNNERDTPFPVPFRSKLSKRLAKHPIIKSLEKTSVYEFAR